MDALKLDGNAAAGALGEVLAVDATTARATCAACGATEAVGAVSVYRGAGLVLRCPHCDAVLVTVVEAGSRVWVDFRGLRSLEVER